MNSAATAALASWHFSPQLIAVFVFAATVYVRGWLRGRRFIRDARDGRRLAAFVSTLVLLFIALDSPLDAFDSLFLSAHMGQHLTLMMIAPALLLLSEPALPLLRGLPKSFVKEGLGPFLTWPALRRFFHWLTSPAIDFILFAFSTVFWHVPQFYELALSSPGWHSLQHASFFWTGVLFWWPVIRPAPGRYSWPVWVGIPYLLAADILNTGLSALFVFSGKTLYPSYSAVRIGGMTMLDDQTIAGAIMWVPGSLIYLIPAVVIAMSLLSPQRRLYSSRPERVRRREQPGNAAWTKALARCRPLAQFVMLAVAIAVVIDGFTGTQVAPMNLAGVLPWIHWRALTVFALLLVGNAFCFACPFVFVRDLARKVLPANFRWPRRLRTKWLSIALLLLFLWAYEAFSLWDRPWLTALIIVAYFVSSILIDGLFRGASFCKYVCPIGQFQFVTSLVSPRQVAVRKPQVCRSCSTYDCIRGNAQSRGCELDLFQPRKASNLDCTFCLDCVKACPHDNVALVNVTPAATLTIDPYRSSIRRLSRRCDFAVLAMVVVFGAFVNAAGMVSPVMMWEHSWHARLGSMALVVGLFIVLGVMILPGLLIALCSLSNRASAMRFVYALVPLGVSMWAAHFLFHFLGAIAPQVTSTPMQLLLLDAGLLLTLYVCWRIAGASVQLAAPWSTLACGLYALGIWILFQPMQMRGMMH
ncbi:MAG: cytochrome c oxidase assembly protein [Acidobacteriaceae bacterium]|nr:cytochrome c oxidase assembly protein [Acidobacteriaceae bacterium]